MKLSPLFITSKVDFKKLSTPSFTDGILFSETFATKDLIGPVFAPGLIHKV